MKSLNQNKFAIIYAFFSSVFFAICIPFAKILEVHISQATMGALLYLGAGIGLLLSLIIKQGKPNLSLTKNELPYAAAMIILDISAILFLMFGISKTTAANASLLGNFELVATSLAAFLIFKERISKKLSTAIFLITIASIILTFEINKSLIFNTGSLLVLFSCICWGLENNCTKMLSSKDTRQITIIKGCFSGLGGLIIAFITKETFPEIKWIIFAMLLGFISYGISVCLYIYAQRFLGASKTGAIFSSAPFFGVLFSLILLNEKPQIQFYIALLIMIIASILIIRDTHNS